MAASSSSLMSSFASVNAVLDDRLYVGNIKAATSPEVLASLGITHIVSVCPEYPSTGPNHLTIPVQDSEYADVLVHLPNACRFIQEALTQPKGKVLVHCMMGVSRSSTVVTAYLMKTKRLSPSAAIKYIRQRRPVIHPNYGFRRQLHAFMACNYELTPDHPVYRSWKRSHKRVMRQYLDLVHDCIAVVPDQILVSSDFPLEDPEKAESILLDLNITHLLSFSSTDKLNCSVAKHTVRPQGPEGVLSALPESCSFIWHALQRGGGPVLVYSESESTACAAICAYLMAAENIPATKASSVLCDALPLFNCTNSFNQILDKFSSSSSFRQLSSSFSRFKTTASSASASTASTTYPLASTLDYTQANCNTQYRLPPPSSSQRVPDADVKAFADRLSRMRLDSTSSSSSAGSHASHGRSRSRSSVAVV